ncbi:ABC transporter permease [Fodinicurvata sp. EGI_FJ10296]|uniref:ABC transporter permease n=1 Tax=Fodinicurvata sp. EGI_FJ10296 TaxID=3231908 RepID=UPI003452732F
MTKSDTQSSQAIGPDTGIAARLSSFAASQIGRLAIITALIFVAMTVLSPERFLSTANMTSMAFQFPEFAILALAMMLAMLTGGIDLSVIGVANLSAICGALTLSTLAGVSATGLDAGLIIVLAIVIALTVGLLAGLINGIAIGHFGLPPILATLGSGLVFTGLGVAITGGSAVIGFPGGFSMIGNGRFIGIPVPVIIFAVLAGAIALMLNRTGYGTRIMLLGANPLAARFSGMNDLRITIRSYMMGGALAATAGLVIMSRANSAKADYGSSYLLLTVLICVLGGINPYGGFGRIAGLVLAVLSLQFFSSGLNMLQVSNFAREFIWGALLLVVMVVNSSMLTGNRR